MHSRRRLQSTAMGSRSAWGLTVAGRAPAVLDAVRAGIIEPAKRPDCSFRTFPMLSSRQVRAATNRRSWARRMIDATPPYANTPPQGRPWLSLGGEGAPLGGARRMAGSPPWLIAPPAWLTRTPWVDAYRLGNAYCLGSTPTTIWLTPTAWGTACLPQRDAPEDTEGEGEGEGT